MLQDCRYGPALQHLHYSGHVPIYTNACAALPPTPRSFTVSGYAAEVMPDTGCFCPCFHFLDVATHPTSNPTRPTEPHALRILEPLLHTDNISATYGRFSGWEMLFRLGFRASG